MLASNLTIDDTNTAPLPDFARHVRSVLWHLGAVHLRVSAFCLRMAGAEKGAAPVAASILEQLSGYAGLLPDGSIGFLYIGPRPQNSESDPLVAESMEARLKAALAQGISGSVRRVRVERSVHGWTDEISTAEDLAGTLAGLTANPATRSSVLPVSNES